MSERVHGVIVTIEVETNKGAYSATLVMEDDESYADFEARIRVTLTELTEVS